MKEINRYKLCPEGSAYIQASPTGAWCGWSDVEELLKQFPEGMEHCTFEVLECDKGHSRLHATNWIDHGCKICKGKELQDKLNDATAKALAAVWLYVGCEVDHSQLHDVYEQARAVLMGDDKKTISRLEDRITQLQLELDNVKKPDLPGVRSVSGRYTTYGATIALRLEALSRDENGDFVIEVKLP